MANITYEIPRMISAKKIKEIGIRGKGSFPKRHRKVANEIDGRVEGYRKIIKEGDCRKYGED